MADTLASAVEQPRAPVPTLEHRKAYCRELTRVLMRYADTFEVEQIAQALEQAAHDITRSRPCPGLNDAAYVQFVRYTLA